VIDEIGAQPGVMPGFVVKVWAEAKAWAKRWTKELSRRPLEAGRDRAWKDCREWLKWAGKRVSAGKE